jgi:hypothetical protein
VGYRLVDKDEYTHEVGEESNWNESRYIDFWDSKQRIGGWFRIGNRVNEGHAEMSAAINLPDCRTAFMFIRPEIDGNALSAGGLTWKVEDPWRIREVSYEGEVIIMDDPWRLVDPKKAFIESPREKAAIGLRTYGQGLESVMGKDQDHIDLIFLPGQAAYHYQALTRTDGTVTIGERTWHVSGRGCMDHSWGPRNWHAKIYLRWIIASFDDDNGFMLVRGVGPTKKTRSGFVWDDGKFHVVDDFDMKNEYAGGPNYELKKVHVTIRSAGREWRATGTPQAWLPLRHRKKGADGKPALLRIVKSPAEWIDSQGREGEGMLEYHDLIVDGQPVGLDD